VQKKGGGGVAWGGGLVDRRLGEVQGVRYRGE
jgi:hypothetical protein